MGKADDELEAEGAAPSSQEESRLALFDKGGLSPLHFQRMVAAGNC